jgi:O-antigen/teichoic acid export membrane protein
MVAEQFHKKDMKQLEELFRINTKWGIYTVLPVVLVIVFAAQDVMTVLFGVEYATGASALLILTIGQFINIATGATGTILIMTGHQTAWFRLSMLIMVVSLTLNLTLIPRWGMVGAAVATATTVGGLFALGLLIVYRVLHLWPYDRRYLKGIGAAIITMGLLFIVRLLDLPAAINLLLTTLVATISFFGILVKLGLDPEDRAFIDLIVKRVKAR